MGSTGARLAAGIAAILVGCSSGGGSEGSPDASRDGSADVHRSRVDASADHTTTHVRDAIADAERSRADAGGDAAPCPPEMIHIETFCVDRYEGYVVEIGSDGERLHTRRTT